MGSLCVQDDLDCAEEKRFENVIVRQEPPENTCSLAALHRSNVHQSNHEPAYSGVYAVEIPEVKKRRASKTNRSGKNFHFINLAIFELSNALLLKNQQNRSEAAEYSFGRENIERLLHRGARPTHPHDRFNGDARLPRIPKAERKRKSK